MNVALLLSLGRKVVAGHTGLANGPWPRTKQHLVGEELSGRVIGIVGFGEIGRLVSRIARGFGMEVLVSDAFLKPEATENSTSLVELDELLERSGVVSLHAPAAKATACQALVTSCAHVGTHRIRPSFNRNPWTARCAHCLPWPSPP